MKNGKYLLVALFFLYTIIPAYSTPNIKLGIDVLIENHFKELNGKKVILLTNNAGRTNKGELTVQAFLKNKNLNLIALLTPEHGFYTTIPAGQKVKDDRLFGLPVYSLYWKDRKPLNKHLKKCDALVIDIQDIGIRSYTFLSTVFNTMQVCAVKNIPVYILDRPNPLGGLVIDGNTLEPEMKSFVGIIPTSYIHGCTIGELATMINKEGWLNKRNKRIRCKLKVIKMKNWHRWMQWEDTGLLWYPTSPHIPTPNAIRGAAVLGVFGELGFISIGIGTTLPFQYIGSPYLNTLKIIKSLGTKRFEGLNLNPIVYEPFYGMYSSKACNGFLLTFPLSNLFTPYSDGFKIILAIRKNYPKLFQSKIIKQKSKKMFGKVTGNPQIFKELFNNGNDKRIIKLIHKGLNNYIKIRQKYLLYK